MSELEKLYRAFNKLNMTFKEPYRMTLWVGKPSTVEIYSAHRDRWDVIFWFDTVREGRCKILTFLRR